MTDAKPCDFAELLECRDCCARWLAGELGVEPFAYPGRAATVLLLGGGLSDKQAEVARVVVWLDRALPSDWVVDEYHRGDRVACYLRPSEHADWYEVETAAPSEEELRLTVELGKREKKLSDELRKLANQWNAAQRRFVGFADVGTDLSDLVAERVRRGRIARRVGPAGTGPDSREEDREAAVRALSNWQPERGRWEAMMFKCATIGAELDVFKEMVQLGLPRGREGGQGFLNITFPNTVEDWQTARRALERRLHVAGFLDPAVGALMPDGGDPAGAGHRVAIRRYRAESGTIEAPV